MVKPAWAVHIQAGSINADIKKSKGRQTMDKLVVVSIDTYRKDNLGKVVEGVPISPFLTKIAREGILYDNYYASANWTIPAYASMFTGKPTVAHNFWGYKLFPGQSADLIFDHLVARGIRPALICCGVLAEADIFQYRSGTYFALPYDMLKPDGAINLLMKALRSNDFVFFHTFLMHDYMHHRAYQSPRFGLKRKHIFLSEDDSETMGEKMKSWREEHFPLNYDDLRILERMYYNECLLVDDFVRVLFEVVLSEFPDTRIIVNSDHGECFSHCGKRAFDGNWHLSQDPLWHHSTGFCYEQFEVFAIDYRQGQEAKVSKALIDHEDIYWMILDHFGLSRWTPGSKHCNLISTSFDKVGFCGVLVNSDIYLYDRNRDFAFILADNLYTSGLIEPVPHLIDSCRMILRSHNVDLAAYSQASEIVRERLRGWGYM